MSLADFLSTAFVFVEMFSSGFSATGRSGRSGSKGNLWEVPIEEINYTERDVKRVLNFTDFCYILTNSSLLLN